MAEGKGRDSTYGGLFSSADPMEELTLGYPDELSGGIVTRILQEMSPEDLAAVHKFAELDRVGFMQHMSYFVFMMMGLQNVDPERKSEGAIEIAQAEIEKSREYFELLGRMDEIPFILSMAGPTPDSYTMDWYLYPTIEDQDIWLPEYGSALDTTEAFLHDPTTEKEYNEQMLDIAFRYTELHTPKSSIVILNVGGTVMRFEELEHTGE